MQAAAREGEAVTRRRYRLLVICTANQCRSPIGEHLWARHLRSAGIATTMRSAGTDADNGDSATEFAIETVRGRGIDLTHHRSQRIGPWIDLADLIVTVTNAQVRDIVAFDRSLWPRTFPLRDLVRRADAEPRGPGEGLADWLERIGATRRRIDLMGDHGPDDIEDPTGESLGKHLALAADLDQLFRRLSASAFGHEDDLGRP